jgi:hypothetical protein
MLPNKKTYIDLDRFFSPESDNGSLPASLPNPNLLGSMTQGSRKMMVGGGWSGSMVGSLDDWYAFDRRYFLSYLGFCELLDQCG